jgi:hypothetical protein
MKIIREYYDAVDDNFTKRNVDDTRRARLTLKHVNKLRKMRELQELENQIHRERLQKIYGSSEGEGDLGI